MNSRTDLALECMDFAGGAGAEGAEYRRFTQGGLACEEVRVSSPRAAERLGKPVGRYLTADPTPFARDSGISFQEAEDLAGCLCALLPEHCRQVLVAGLGNRSITPDAYGPQVADQILVTRHLPPSLTRQIGLDGVNPVSAVAPGVLGQTGVESAELIQAVCRLVQPQAVIVVDALACSGLERLGRTVQMSDAGIVPGSGVHNNRRELSRNTLGVPVIGVGVPMVAEIDGGVSPLIVTPREIDLILEHAAKLTACAINKALQPTLSVEEILSLTS